MTVLALVGPTASGKSSVAMDVATARAEQVEVVAVDAFTVYRGMDIATAKPSPQQRASVPHHMIDVLDPWEEVSVAWFQQAARAAIDDVRGRGATPLLVGGSGLYFRAVVDPLRFPPTDPQVRAELEQRWEGQPEHAHRELGRLDPAAAAGISPTNLRRTVRALEVIRLTGEPFSTFDDAWDRHESIFDLDVAYLEPPTSVLRARIEQRAQDMVHAGLIDEARRLRDLPHPLSRTARQAIGTAEALAVLDGSLPIDDLAGAVAQRTWAYARRQRSWFRRDPRCVPASADAVRQRWSVAR